MVFTCPRRSFQSFECLIVLLKEFLTQFLLQRVATSILQRVESWFFLCFFYRNFGWHWREMRHSLRNKKLTDKHCTVRALFTPTAWSQILGLNRKQLYCGSLRAILLDSFRKKIGKHCLMRKRLFCSIEQSLKSALHLKPKSTVFWICQKAENSYWSCSFLKELSGRSQESNFHYLFLQFQW